jgi:hypothetical protein
MLKSFQIKELILSPFKLAIFSIIFVDNESFLGIKKYFSLTFFGLRQISSFYSQLTSVDKDASIFSIGGYWPHNFTSFESAAFC